MYVYSIMNIYEMGMKHETCYYYIFICLYRRKKKSIVFVYEYLMIFDNKLGKCWK